MKLNKTKCQIRRQSIVFLGIIISSEGIKIDPSKTGAITKMSLLKSVNELQRFLGMVYYLGKFIPNLAEHTIPLRTFLKKNVVFQLHYFSKDFRFQIANLFKNRCQFSRIRRFSQTKVWNRR